MRVLGHFIAGVQLLHFALNCFVQILSTHLFYLDGCFGLYLGETVVEFPSICSSTQPS
uniref:Uncharacterized protein n=1 Tax=Rhizophora mucronata TaxID=61149 RepID=A0A2P2N4C6_RHIMU